MCECVGVGVWEWGGRGGTTKDASPKLRMVAGRHDKEVLLLRRAKDEEVRQSQADDMKMQLRSYFCSLSAIILA